MDFLQNLAPLVDQPEIPWKKLIVGFFLAQYLFETALSLRQFRVLQRKKPPKSLEGEVAQDVFDKSQEYGRAKIKFKLVNDVYALVLHLVTVYGNMYARLWALTGAWLARYALARLAGEIPHSVAFFIAFAVVQSALGVPASVYQNFVLEARFGFNKLTLRTFAADLAKEQALLAAIGAPAVSALLAIIRRTAGAFYYYVWAFNIALQLFMITIYPIAILPLFNKLSPLQDGALKERVEALARRLHFPLTNLFVIDGSKRSAHSNAYFFGLPWKKHIVIYDTLIEKSETQEIVAVLGHELGHWSLSHTIKLFALNQFHAFYILALFSIFINNRSLFQAFGFHNEYPVFVGLVLFNEILAPLDILITFTSNIISRRFEFEADAFAVKLGYASDLARSLIKLQITNLSTMDADWLYATYHYSHPILPERLRALGWYGEGGKEQLQRQDAAKLAKDDDGGVVKAADREL